MNDMNGTPLDPEKLIPLTQSAFRLDQVAKMFSTSVQHLFTLITEGELVVPKENIEAAKSRPCILVPRKNLVDFVRRRSSPEWFAQQRRERTQKRNNGKKGRRQ